MIAAFLLCQMSKSDLPRQYVLQREIENAAFSGSGNKLNVWLVVKSVLNLKKLKKHISKMFGT